MNSRWSSASYSKRTETADDQQTELSILQQHNRNSWCNSRLSYASYSKRTETTDDQQTELYILQQQNRNIWWTADGAVHLTATKQKKLMITWRRCVSHSNRTETADDQLMISRRSWASNSNRTEIADEQQTEMCTGISQQQNRNSWWTAVGAVHLTAT